MSAAGDDASARGTDGVPEAFRAAFAPGVRQDREFAWNVVVVQG